MKAFHFLPADRRLRYGDGRKVRDGETLSYINAAPPKLCERGMHASVRCQDALGYAPGAVLCVVDVTGDVTEGDDKIVGRHRKVLWSAGEAVILPLIVEYARWCAERAKGYAYANAASDAAATWAATWAADADAAAFDATWATANAVYVDAAAASATWAAANAAAAAVAAAAAEREAQEAWWTEKLIALGAPL